MILDSGQDGLEALFVPRHERLIASLPDAAGSPIMTWAMSASSDVEGDIDVQCWTELAMTYRLARHWYTPAVVFSTAKLSQYFMSRSCSIDMRRALASNRTTATVLKYRALR